MKTSRSSRSAQRGAVLIVALLFSAILAISLVSYLKLSNHSLKLADRTFKNLSALNLTEAGIEEAIYAFNQSDNTSLATAFTGWTTSANNATRTFNGFALGENTNGIVKVYVRNYNSTGSVDPVVVAKAMVTPPSGPTIERWVEATLRRRGLFTQGLVARQSLELRSNVFVDSYKSDSDDNPATPGVQFSTALRRSNCFVGCTSAVNGAINLNGSSVSVHGRVASGGGTVTVNVSTSVYDANDGALVHPPVPPIYNSSLVTTDFSATFPAVTVPSPSAQNLVTSAHFKNADRTLPQPGDVQASDGRYYYVFSPGYNVELTSNYTLTINDRVTLILNNHNGVNAIRLASNDDIYLGTNGSLHVYTNGHVRSTSNATLNAQKSPENFIIYGTNSTPGGQTVELNSNTISNVAVYAPNAHVMANSNAQFSGSVIANSIWCDSNVRFHYDESLAGYVAGNPFGVMKWRELASSAERAAYESGLNF